MANPSEEEICAQLRATPDMMYVTPDSRKLYVYIPANDGVLCITAEDDLSEMDSEQLNRFLQDCLIDLTE